MAELRFGVLGAGFWAPYQVAAWAESGAARCTAVCDVDRAKAQRLADRFAIPAVYDDPAAMLDQQPLDFVDIITTPATHHQLVLLAAAHRTPAICQKPLAESLAAAQDMAAACHAANVPLLVHENWRWQRPIRQLRRHLDEGAIGRPFRANIQFCSSFPVFDNQPFLRQLDRFILADVGTHVLDTARFLFGEARSLYCRTRRVNPDIRGEDVATVMIETDADATVLVELSYASRTEHERFPQTFIHVEADAGSLQLAPDYWLRRTTADGTWSRRYPPPVYDWAHPEYALIHGSMVPCVEHLAAALRGERPAETTADDNLRTLRLVEAAYQSARHNRPIDPRAPDPPTHHAP